MYAKLLEQFQHTTQLELRITHVVEKSKDEIGMRIILRQYKKVKGRDLVNADII